MRADESVEDCVERRLRDFRLHDRVVDVVSSFEMVFTESQSQVPGTVARFERFPSIPVADRELSPDFSVLFQDGTGLVGEIARFALRDESVDDLCDQILKYDALTGLPSQDGITDVEFVDVLLFVPLDLGPASAIRILEERLLRADHPYKPGRHPCIIQYGFDEGRYLFQRIQHASNGLPEDANRPDGIGRWFRENGDIRARPDRFAHIKAARAFVNDGIDDLYLTVHLWAKTFATMAGEQSNERPIAMTIDPEEIARNLREAHGRVRVDDVRRALSLLERAKLAEPNGAGGWTVGWEELRGEDLAATLAKRICYPPRTGGPLNRVRRRVASAKPADTGQEERPRLF